MTSTSNLCGLPHPELGWPCTEPAGHPHAHRHRPADPGGVEVWWNDYGKGKDES